MRFISDMQVGAKLGFAFALRMSLMAGLGGFGL